MLPRLVRRYATAAYRNKKSTLLPSSDETSADFAARNEAIFSGPQSPYPLLNQVYSAVKSKNQSNSNNNYNDNSIKVIRVNEFQSKFSNVTHDENQYLSQKKSSDRTVVQGRINSIRKAGKNLIFVDIVQDMKKLQIVINKGKMEDSGSDEKHQLLRRGDHVSVEGVPWRTKTGELSILALKTVELVTPCLYPLPTNLKDETTRLHNRVVDMIVHPEMRDVLVTRSNVLAYIREFLNERDFVEVSTPIMSTQAGGATASPFTTFSNALSESASLSEEKRPQELALRIAPELWLKRLVIGGLDKVYEIGPSFRNEGIDATHNPEFYTCEFYQSFTTLDELINMTEQLLKGVVDRVCEKQKNSTIDQNGRLLSLQSDFATGFKRIDFIPEIERLTGKQLPSELTTESLLEYMKSLSILSETGSREKPNAASLLDQLASIYLEPQCTKPTVIMNHPQVMAPLAKSAHVTINGIERHVSRRFELFIEGREYVNAYEEENSPFVQLSNLQAQAGVEHELEIADQGFVDALKWGLPPTGGWGLGIERLVMLLTGSSRIDQVLSFGTVKSVNYQ